MNRVFFSYASEDFDLVNSVRNALLEVAPELEVWIDVYEITAGESLITRIAEGIESAEKFVIFLSPGSITKPWVNRELQKAIMHELNGIDPNFIVPIRAGAISKMPPFIEAKKYINLEVLTKNEWIAEIRSVIDGNYELVSKPSSPNVTHAMAYGVEGRHVIKIIFTAHGWAEEFSYGVDTAQTILEAGIDEGGVFTMTNTIREPFRYAHKFESPLLRPGKPIAIRIAFEPNIDGKKAIKEVFEWKPN